MSTHRQQVTDKSTIQLATWTEINNGPMYVYTHRQQVTDKSTIQLATWTEINNDPMYVYTQATGH